MCTDFVYIPRADKNSIFTLYTEKIITLFSVKEKGYNISLLVLCYMFWINKYSWMVVIIIILFQVVLNL